MDAPCIEVSVVMPCLNEAQTLATCIGKASLALERMGVPGEIVVADNGSTDGSQELALALGARVVQVAERGYGAALRGGIAAARGEFVVIGDADDSYDFSIVGQFVDRLRDGHDLVMGNRFLGGIMPGAMPWKHRHLGNPVLTGIGRLFFRCPVGDFHCGLRAFRRKAYDSMQLATTGMEFASEMVIKSCLAGLRIAEIPVTLYKDGRSRPPHLRSWRDGWRHLRFMLLFSPRWLFLYPGIGMLVAGLALSAWLLGGTRHVGSVRLDIHSLLVGGFLCILGYQLLAFGAFARLFAAHQGLRPMHRHLIRLTSPRSLELGLLAGVVLFVAGAGLFAAAFYQWRGTGFGDLTPQNSMRVVIPGLVLLTLGAQTIFASFFLGILELRRPPAAGGRCGGAGHP